MTAALATTSARRPRRSLARSATAHVYALLRQAIITLELPPGRALSENVLAQLYEVSRTPVREALIRLADEGLVEVVPQLGTYVARISVAEVVEHQFIREMLERGSLPRAIENVTSGDVALLRDVLAEQAKAGAGRDISRWFETDQTLHRTLLEVAGHRRAWTIVSSARAHLDRVRLLSLPDPALLSTLHAQHTEIVELVAVGDVGAADDLLARHLRLVLDVLGPLRARFPDYFDDDDERDTPLIDGAREPS